MLAFFVLFWSAIGLCNVFINIECIWVILNLVLVTIRRVSRQVPGRFSIHGIIKLSQDLIERLTWKFDKWVFRYVKIELLCWWWYKYILYKHKQLQLSHHARSCLFLSSRWHWTRLKNDLVFCQTYFYGGHLQAIKSLIS